MTTHSNIPAWRVPWTECAYINPVLLIYPTTPYPEVTISLFLYKEESLMDLNSVQLLSRVWLFVTPWTHQASLSITNYGSLPKLMFIESMMPSNHLLFCHPLLLLLNLSQHQVLFQWVNSSLRWPKYWSFSFSIRPSCEHPGLISFRMGWLDLLEVQGTLRSLLQHHNAKASVLQSSAFFTVQLSHPYMTLGKL